MFDKFNEGNWIAFGAAVVSLLYNVFNTLYARSLNRKSVHRTRFTEDVKKRINELSDQWADFSDCLEEEALRLQRGEISNLDSKKILDEFNKVRRDGSRIIDDIGRLKYFKFTKFHRIDEGFMDYFYEKYEIISSEIGNAKKIEICKLLSRECDTFRSRLKSITSEYENNFN